MRATTTTASVAVLCGLAVAGTASAAPFLDDFSSDTTANYSVTNGTIGVAGGVLTGNNGSTTTTSVNIVHNDTAHLEVGEFAAVDIVTNPREVMLIISTQQLQPNASGPSGIRLSAYSTEESVRARVYGSGTSASPDTTYAGIAGVTSLFVYRDAADSFRVGYDNGDGVEFLGDPLTVPNTAAADGLFVGVQLFHNVANSDFAVDNLRIAAIPEPAALSLVGLGGVMFLRRRGRRA